MKRELLSKDESTKLYREFSRKKYNKYKHQYPRMRETELVSKIIKEWENMSQQEKYDLSVQYNDKGDSKSESSEKKSPGSSRSKDKNKKKSASKKYYPTHETSISGRERSSVSDPKTKDTGSRSAKKKPVKAYTPSPDDKKPKSESSDFARDGAKKDFEVSDSDSKEQGKNAGKKKMIKKSTQPRTEYLKFFQFYYDRLSNEHPRWTPNQISTIIKLLWKKKLSQEKGRKDPLRQPKLIKLSARMAFRRHHTYNALEALLRWRQLPKESRIHWKIKGLGLSKERKPDHLTIRLKNDKKTDSSIKKNLDFMSSRMVEVQSSTTQVPAPFDK